MCVRESSFQSIANYNILQHDRSDESQHTRETCIRFYNVYDNNYFHASQLNRYNDVGRRQTP